MQFPSPSRANRIGHCLCGRRFYLLQCMLSISSLLPLTAGFHCQKYVPSRLLLSRTLAFARPLGWHYRIERHGRLFLSSSSPAPLSLTHHNITEYSEISEWLGYDDVSSYEPRQVLEDEEHGSELLAEYQQWSQALDQAVTALQKKRKSLQLELTKAQGAEKTMARAQLLVSNLYLFQDASIKKATVMDWENDVEVELELSNKYESASAEADALFAQARKLKRGSQVVADLLEETVSAGEILEGAQKDLHSAYDNDLVDEGRFALVKDRLIRTSHTTKFQVPRKVDNSGRSDKGNQSNNRRERKPELGTPASNIRKIKSPGGCTIYVGRNRRGNEYISLTLARGNDIWMHSRGCPGAHVLILNRRGGPPVTDACLQLAADLAIFYSDLRNEAKAQVTAAEPKHILKPRGAPLGAVKIREEWKTFVGRPDQVPDELKMAREESGQTDEYHMMDKAKHRRRTKQAAEEDQNKRRQRQKERRAQH
ncbi:fibronectin-binding protein [Nitzschia inconspicua]|uniref:Fibronectin-binding protein n=1 Tax=Nitzschia inconspicua TaxID=303405 RepID=A0A9K3Q0F1_9STRA|nr:fibronectin-binding protein [Nitzschia inconspicua]